MPRYERDPEELARYQDATSAMVEICRPETDAEHAERCAAEELEQAEEQSE